MFFDNLLGVTKVNNVRITNTMYDTTKDERLLLRRAIEELAERSKVLPKADKLIMLMHYRDGFVNKSGKPN